MSNPGGKGSAPRPMSVSDEEYSRRWDAIFRRDVPTEADLAQQALEVSLRTRPLSTEVDANVLGDDN